jgi:hypothetical protein
MKKEAGEVLERTGLRNETVASAGEGGERDGDGCGG